MLALHSKFNACFNPKRRPVFFLLGALSALGQFFILPLVQAQGIPEPDLIVYGVVRNTSAGNARITFGELQWQFQPADGSPSILVTTKLTNINDQFSYVLRIPAESELPGEPFSPNKLKLRSTPLSYDRSQVTLDGKPATLAPAHSRALVVTSRDRGKIERVDLEISTPVESFDAWAQRIFGSATVSQSEDPDQDGMSNFAEYKAGTDPKDAQSLFEFVDATPNPSSGIVIRWASVASKSYSLLRSTDLLSGYVEIARGIAATPPVNSYQDTGAAAPGPHFYRLQVLE